MTAESAGRTPVVIVGGGPVGLSLALGLARHGVRSTLLEREPTTSEHSKAGGVLLRTRELLRRWGVDGPLREAGTLVSMLTLHDAARHNRPLAAFDLSVVADEARDPGILVLPQSRTEQILLDAVRASGRCDVRFGTEVVDVRQDTDGVTVTTRGPDGEQRLDARIAVGCDGAGSTVRRALKLPFEGITYALRPMLADVRVDEQHDRLPWPRVRNDRDGLMFTLRLAPRLWRIVRLDRGDGGDDGDDERACREAGRLLGVGPAEVVWVSRFAIHRRSAPRFRVGRVLLAGDAAHVHSPAGGQGMNAGIQDAANLAWKLAHALDGGDLDRLLASYDVERRAVVVGNVTRYTDLVTRAVLQAPPVLRGVGLAAQRVLQRSTRVARATARRASMIDLDYPASPLLDRRQPAAGRRLPDVVLRSAAGDDVRLHDLLPTGAALLHVGAGDGGPSADLPVDEVIRVGAGAHHDPTGTLRGLLGGADGWILVRPDTHIAWARSRADGLEAAARAALGRRR